MSAVLDRLSWTDDPTALPPRAAGFTRVVVGMAPPIPEVSDRRDAFDVAAERTSALAESAASAETAATGVGYGHAATLPTWHVALLLDATDHAIASGAAAVVVDLSVPPAGLSPADAALDPWYERLAAAGVPLVLWAGAAMFDPRLATPPLRVTFEPATSHLAVTVPLSAMVCGGVLDRHPRLRVATVGTQTAWIGAWLDAMASASTVFARRWPSPRSAADQINSQIEVWGPDTLADHERAASRGRPDLCRYASAGPIGGPRA